MDLKHIAIDVKFLWSRRDNLDMKASEPKLVNSILHVIRDNLLSLEDLQFIW